jgi:tetratricopeptide (TPR) repeat protein
MVHSDPRICPSPEVLGAFIEGTLDAPVRAAVRRHVASCSQCVFVVGEANAFLSSDEAEADEESEGPRAGWLWTAAIAAVIALTCAAAAAWFITRWRDPLDRVRRAAAAAPTRPIEGQLADFAYAPYRAIRSDVAEVDPRLRVEAERLVHGGGGNARAWHARGVASLILGDDANAVTMLQKAIALSPQNASYWSDLAAARVAAGTHGDQTELRNAASAASRAEAIDPSLVSAPFNHALALEHLGDLRGAARAYERCLTLRPSESWATEIRLRRARLTG